MTRPLDKEVLTEAVAKTSTADMEAWTNQTGVDLEALMEMMEGFAISNLENSPLLLLFSTDESLSWLVASFAAAFHMGWCARIVQTGEPY